MPSQKGQKRAQGGGRVANSEPRIQVFKDFAGVNFNNSGEFSLNTPVDSARISGDQTYLQMNYTFLQNNVAVASDKTLVTRDDLVRMYVPPSGRKFTGPAITIGSQVLAAKNDGNIGYAGVHSSPNPIVMSDNVELDNRSGAGHVWTSFDYYDDKIVALTSQRELWISSEENLYSIRNAKQIPNPTSANIGDQPNGCLEIQAVGSLTYGSTKSTTNKYRICIAFAWLGIFGPTKLSPKRVLYVSHPVSEWSSARHLSFSFDAEIIDPNRIYEITGVELFYSADNATELIYLGRASEPGDHLFEFDWYGYIDSTDSWAIGNLVPPSENYTKGVRASKTTNIDGRIYFWGDTSNPQRLYIGGNPGNLFSVSIGTGGGFVDVEPGTDKAVKYVCKYKTQSGNSIVTMLCDSPNTRKEQRYNLVENNISLSNEQMMNSWQAEQVAGAIGCKSYDGAIACADGLYSVSRYGLALTTMTMEYNSQIQTNYVSDNIKPVFSDVITNAEYLSVAHLLELDGILYMALGSAFPGKEGTTIDNVLFCYDIGLKSWWTHTLDVDSPILNLFHVDYEGGREGIGIVTEDAIYMLPTTRGDDETTNADHSFLIETAEISTQMPQQSWQYLSQLEFHFDRFVGDMTIEVRMIDIFGRDLKVRKTISEEDVQYNHVVRMRVDQRVMSYVITMSGTARFRMTHFLARVYTTSNKIGQVWGFDDSISHRSSGSIHPTFKCYNDVRKAIFT